MKVHFFGLYLWPRTESFFLVSFPWLTRRFPGVIAQWRVGSMTAKCSDCRSETSLAETLLPGIRFVLSNRELKLRVAALLIYVRQKKKVLSKCRALCVLFFSTQRANEGCDTRKTTVCIYIRGSILSDATTQIISNLESSILWSSGHV